MKREIYEVHFTVVDENGTWSIPSGYPKTFKSESYNNDLQKTLKRAKGEMGSIEKAMSTQDTRQIQFASLIRVSDGVQLEVRKFGELAELPDPEPEPEPEPEESEGGEG